MAFVETHTTVSVSNLIQKFIWLPMKRTDHFLVGNQIMVNPTFNELMIWMDDETGRIPRMNRNVNAIIELQWMGEWNEMNHR